jgi:hypothetical protein
MMGQGIKKIYSAVDADEIQALREQGYRVYGYFDETLDGIINTAEKEYRLSPVDYIATSDKRDRFGTDEMFFNLFALVKVTQEIDVTNEVVKL